ncbi:MAG: tetratricopeptide repeat protein [Pedosphaera sp.]|nr:tetratricopeptide repeat protein [Pedosphaera sp.]
MRRKKFIGGLVELGIEILRLRCHAKQCRPVAGFGKPRMFHEVLRVFGAVQSYSIRVRVLFVVLLGLSLMGCGRKAALDPDLARFVADKRKQTKEIADLQPNGAPTIVWRFFDKVERGDWDGASSIYARMEDSLWLDKGPDHPPAGMLQEVRRTFDLDASIAVALRSELWSPITETHKASRLFHDWDRKWLRRFSQDIIQSVPPGSIYFGGTDFGWCAISAFCISQREGRPFFILNQNRLRDAQYLQYVRGMYSQLQIPTPTEVDDAIRECLEDESAQRRRGQHDPIELMSLEWAIMKTFREKNPAREIYVEESYWMLGMYPYTEPHGVIMKIQREPVQMSDAILARDRICWNKYVAELLGDWLREETSVKEVCDFAEKVYQRGDFAGFKGDLSYLRNRETQKGFSKLRKSIASLYSWRALHAKSPEEKARMTKEADFAARQAFALCPSSPDALFVYVNALLSENRLEEARLVAKTSSHLIPKDPAVQDLLQRLQDFKPK